MPIHGRRFSSSILKKRSGEDVNLSWRGFQILRTYRYLGWLIAYTQGSMHETILQAIAGIIVAAGVRSLLSPKAPNSVTIAYGVQAQMNRKNIVKAALAIRISTLVAFWSWLADNDLTFIFFACSRNIFSWAQTWSTYKFHVLITLEKKSRKMLSEIGVPGNLTILVENYVSERILW